MHGDGKAMKAAAYIVGPLDGPGAGLLEMARRLDFAVVLPYAGIIQAEQQANQTPVCFFLFAAVPDVASLRGVSDAIRFSPSRRIRFSPLIYFSESPSIETITRCINMGFDDVITMPFTRVRVTERINRQIGRNLTYYETAGYFGPDRRDRVTGPKRAAESRQGGQFRRLEIVRNLLTGVNVVRDDLYMQPATESAALL
jgi:DNA-binding response OmpR family regulator